jgi:hypothetical protein
MIPLATSECHLNICILVFRSNTSKCVPFWVIIILNQCLTIAIYDQNIIMRIYLKSVYYLGLRIVGMDIRSWLLIFIWFFILAWVEALVILLLYTWHRKLMWGLFKVLVRFDSLWLRTQDVIYFLSLRIISIRFYFSLLFTMDAGFGILNGVFLWLWCDLRIVIETAWGNWIIEINWARIILWWILWIVYIMICSFERKVCNDSLPACS